MSIDQNRIKTILCEKHDGSKDTIKVVANETNHSLSINSNTVPTDSDKTYGARDANREPVLIAVSSVDGVTPIPIYADESGAILIEIN